jgi:hypothetical protein
MLDAALKLGSQINREWRLRQKWLFSVASIILNALITKPMIWQANHKNAVLGVRNRS